MPSLICPSPTPLPSTLSLFFVFKSLLRFASLPLCLYLFFSPSLPLGLWLSFSNSTYEWKHMIPFSDLFHLALYSPVPSTLLQMVGFHSFSLPSSIPSQGDPHFSFSLHLSPGSSETPRAWSMGWKAGHSHLLYSSSEAPPRSFCHSGFPTGPLLQGVSARCGGAFWWEVLRSTRGGGRGCGQAGPHRSAQALQFRPFSPAHRLRLDRAEVGRNNFLINHIHLLETDLGLWIYCALQRTFCVL